MITNRVGAVVRIFAIGSIIFGGSIFLLVGNRPTESAEENRKLATPPSFSMDALESGDYIADWMHYYEDTVPGRSNFKHMISKLESYQGLQGEDKVQFYGNIAPVKKDTESEKKDNVTTTAPVASGNSAGVTQRSLLSPLSRRQTLLRSETVLFWWTSVPSASTAAAFPVEKNTPQH